MARRLAEARAQIQADWDGAPYYAQAEAWLDFFWNPARPVRPWFDRLDLTRVVELACGHGRHAAQCLDRVGHITLVDLNASNIRHCRERFGDDPRVSYLVNNGRDLGALGSGLTTALYCYDAMVHFELLDVIGYLAEIQRILVPGGRALLHVSNNTENPGGGYQENRHWRNFGGVDVLRHLADRLDVPCIAHRRLDWGDARDLDGLMLLERR